MIFACALAVKGGQGGGSNPVRERAANNEGSEVDILHRDPVSDLR